MEQDTVHQKGGKNTAEIPAGQRVSREAVVLIRLSDLHPFPNHPFKVREDEAMKETIESVKDVGVLTPAIVRPRKEGGYTIQMIEQQKKERKKNNDSTRKPKDHSA